jgi:DNA invertase Pin-like site-specific DNA recombinase
VATRAGLYLRISRARPGEVRGDLAQEGELLGADKQRGPCEALCERLGWEIVGIYVDDDLSAYSGRVRPEFERLLAEAEAGYLQAIVAWHPDRLSRNPDRDNQRLIDLAERHGIKLATATVGEHDLSSPAGRLMFRQLGMLARYESEHRAERVEAWHDRMARAGRWHGGRRPFGYQYRPRAEGGGLVIDLGEAALIREAVDRLLAGGTLSGIAADWRERRVMLGASGRPLGVTQIAGLLSSPHLAAIREHKGERTPGAWEPIITPDTHEAVTAVIERRRNGPPQRTTRQMLSGIARCGRCGTAMVGSPQSTRDGGSQPGYRCNTQRGGCGRLHRAAEPIDRLVADAVLTALAGPGLAEATGRAAQAGNGRQGDLLAALRVTEANLERITDDYSDGFLGRAEFARQRARLEDRLAGLHADLARLAGTGALVGIPTDLDALRAAWDGWALDRRRAVLRAVVESVTVLPIGRGVRLRPEHLEITWKA